MNKKDKNFIKIIPYRYIDKKIIFSRIFILGKIKQQN
jgi:hypothetical protein